jgi:hypothetical protein
VKNPIIKSRLGRLLIGPAMVGALVGGIGVATAQTGDDADAPTTTVTEAPAATQETPAAAAQEDGPAPEGAAGERPPRPDGPPPNVITGETADKVAAAALAKVPGATVDRVQDNGGENGYHAHLTKADGSKVRVEVNEAFEVTSVTDDVGCAPGHRGPGGPGGPGGGTPLTGEAADRATAAAQQAGPGGTVERVTADRDGDGYHAHVVKADGTHVRVEMTEDFTVTSVEEHTGPGPRPGPPPAEQPSA